MSHRLPVNGNRCLSITWHSTTPNNPTGKYFSPSPQASQPLSITATLNKGNTQKVDVFPQPISHRMSHRLPRQRQSMPLKYLAPSDAEKPDRKWYSPSPQASQHFSITATPRIGNTHKVGVVRRPLSHRMSHRLLVERQIDAY
jgi:hypothetical protein